jgi:hypothetical protein
MKTTPACALAVLLLAACSTNTPLQGVRVEAITPLEAVWVPAPEIQRHSPATMAGGGLVFGGFGMEAAAADQGRQLRERCGLEDFGALALRAFAEAAPRSVPSFAGIQAAQRPVADPPRRPGAYVLAVKTEMVWIYTFTAVQGLNVAATATITAPTGGIVWQYTATYSSREARRVRGIEELEADSCRLLKEEMRDAADKLAADWVSDLTGVRR